MGINATIFGQLVSAGALLVLFTAWVLALVAAIRLFNLKTIPGSGLILFALLSVAVATLCFGINLVGLQLLETNGSGSAVVYRVAGVLAAVLLILMPLIAALGFQCLVAYVANTKAV